LGEHSKEKVYYGVKGARGDDGHFIGWQVFRMERGIEGKGSGVSTDVGDVQPFTNEGHFAAIKIAHAAGEAEGVYPECVLVSTKGEQK
jgi:hypothetical protein